MYCLNMLQPKHRLGLSGASFECGDRTEWPLPLLHARACAVCLYWPALALGCRTPDVRRPGVGGRGGPGVHFGMHGMLAPV